MTSAASTPRTLVITGDFTLDWNLALGQKLGGGSRSLPAGQSAHQRWQRGGAALLADLIAEVTRGVGGGAGYSVRTLDAPKRAASRASGHVGPESERFHHSTALWLPHDYEPEDLDGKAYVDGKEGAGKPWRVAEFLGVHRSQSDDVFGEWASVKDDDPNAALVVLDDGALGFRDREDLWPASLKTADNKRWIVAKTSQPVAQGPLWEKLCKDHANRTIAVMTVNDLRLTNVQICRELSWERTAQDLMWEMLNNENLDGLRKCAHVVISFNAAGAFLYSFDREAPKCRLIFDPMVIEGMWEQARPGAMVGYSTCLVAGVAGQLMGANPEDDIAAGIRSGLNAMRTLHLEGYGERGAKPDAVKLAFPSKLVAKALAFDPGALTRQFPEIEISIQAANRYWTILGKQYPDGVEKIAAEVVKKGADKVLIKIPFGVFGGLTTVDRQETESLRSIRALATEYLDQDKPKRPLSIAVFGPPGSGKSFGITQLALALRPGDIEVREFNLSQLQSTDELLAAFHQVRDIGLSGKIPLIFWDEFDSAFDAPFGWLKYFLAPMQDGKFLQHNLPHPIGRAIFVFAGGTSATLQDFGRGLTQEQASAAKLPDFVSRLKGYMNVLGPNPVKGRDDPHYTLRRALLLRSMLKRDARQIEVDKELRIDSGVLRAMLETTNYKHGARSMESVIAMCRLGGKTRFERSALPSQEQLDLHVDGKNFLALVHQPEGARLEMMAKEAHEIYREPLFAKGWTCGPEKSKEKKTNPNLAEFENLRPNIKEQNLDQVRDIFRKLESIGCSMAPAKASEPLFEFTTEVLEALASMEHTRWMRQMARDEWRWGPEPDDAKRFHPCLLPWKKGDFSPYEGFEDRLGTDELSEEEKDKDRVAVRNIPRILKKGGYTILPPVKSQPELLKKEQIEPGKQFPATVTIQPRME